MFSYKRLAAYCCLAIFVFALSSCGSSKRGGCGDCPKFNYEQNETPAEAELIEEIC